MKPRIYMPSETDFSTNGLGILKDCTRCEVYEVSNGKYELELDYPLGTRFDEYFENDYQIKAKSNDQEDYHIFFIDDKDIDTFLDTVTIYAQSRTNRLGRRAVTTVAVQSATAQQAMASIENGMDKKSDIRLYSDITTVSSTLFEARNVLNCIAGEQGSLLQYWGGEIKREPFKLSLLKRRGRDNIGTIRYGKDLSGLKVKLDWTGVKTRIIPYVDAQSDTGVSDRIYGIAVDSEYINNYPDVYTEHIQFTEEQGAKDKKSLDNIAKNYFKSINPGCDKPKISITIDFNKLTDSEEAKEFAKVRNYGLFDTFKVYHKKYNLYFDSKVSGVQFDSLTEKTIKLEAGDTQVAFYQQQSNAIQDKLKEYATNNYMSSFNDYVSSMITGQGQAGGYVLLWPKERPSNIFIMDDPDLNKAKEVLRMNKNGIAFSKNGWNGPFNSAWTLDSIFNANFIKTGIIQADVFENSFSNTGDTLKLVNGLLQIWNNKKKFMELTKKGLQFWSDKGEIGTIGTTDSAGNPFPNASTSTPIENNSLVIRSNEKKFIIISPGKEKGFVMLDGAPTAHFGDMTIQGEMRVAKEFMAAGGIRGPVKISGDVDIKGKLTLNGKEVYPGQGGGSGGSTGGIANGWDGTYPSGVTTSAEKFAWQAWVTLLSLGYSKAAAAGILGNINGEAGPSMNPDIDQIGGPAYGAIQFDGSMFPLVPPATNDGRIYVQNLMRAAGITGDYRHMVQQMQLVNWANSNGQWIGKVQPTTVAGFKAMSDPAQAAYVFENNFERPATSHPDRQGFAVNWYNKFKDLQIPQSNSDIVSVAKSLLGYFTYALVHGESYIGSVANPDRNGITDCSGFVWLVLAKAGYRVPGNMQWFTGSMAGDARGPHNWFREINENDTRAGDVVIYNVGGGAGANGHTAILLEKYRGNDTQIIQMGGDGRYSGVNTSTIGYSFGSLLGGDRCLARAVK